MEKLKHLELYRFWTQLQINDWTIKSQLFNEDVSERSSCISDALITSILKKEGHTSVFLAAVAAETKWEFNLLYYIKPEVIHHKVTELQRKWVIAHL